MNQLRNFYINAIAEDAGLLELTVERLIRSKIIADYNEKSRNIAEVSQNASEQAKLLQGREFFFLSVEDIAERIGVLPENLNKTIGNSTLKIPNAFEENYKTFYALEEKDFNYIKDSFPLAWKKTIALEKDAEARMDHSFEEPDTPSVEEETDVDESDAQKQSDLPAASEAESQKQIKDEKKKRRKDDKRKTRDRQNHDREKKLKHSEQIKEEQEGIKSVESVAITYNPVDSMRYDHPDIEKTPAFGSDHVNTYKPQDNTIYQEYMPSQNQGISQNTAEDRSFDTALHQTTTFSSSDMSSQSHSAETIDYSHRQEQTSFTPIYQDNPFQIYSGRFSGAVSCSGENQRVQTETTDQMLSGVRRDSDTITVIQQTEAATNSNYSDLTLAKDQNLPNAKQNPVTLGDQTKNRIDTGYNATEYSTNTTERSAGEALSGIKRDSDTIAAVGFTTMESKEEIPNNYCDPVYHNDTTNDSSSFENDSRNRRNIAAAETMITYQGRPITSYAIVAGVTTLEFNNAQEMLQSPYCTDQPNIHLTTITGERISLSSQEVNQLQTVCTMDYAETNIKPVSAYYEQQIIENNCFYNDMPVVAVERTPYNEIFGQNTTQLFNTPDSVDTICQSIREKKKALCNEYRLVLANGENVPITPDNFQQIQYVLPVSLTTDDGFSNQEIADAIRTRSKSFASVTGLVKGSKIPSADAIKPEHIELIRKKMEPSRKLTMQESGLFTSSSSDNKSTSMMFMSDSVEDFTNYSVSVASKGNQTDGVSLNHIHHREYMEHGFACAVGQAAFKTTGGSSDLMRSIRQTGRYVGWVNPLLQGVNTSVQQKARLGKFQKNNQMGLVKNQLRTCGVNTALLYERDKFGRRKTKENPLNGEKTFLMKKQLSPNDIKGIMSALDKKFAFGNTGSVRLSALSDKELTKLIKTGGKNGELAKVYKNMKGLQDIAGKKNGHFASMKQSLKGVMSSLLYDSDVYQGMYLMNSYIRVAKRTIASFIHKNRRGRQKIAEKLIRHSRPLRAHADVKLRTQRNKERRKRHAKQKKLKRKATRKQFRKDKRWERLTGRKKSAWKRDIHNRFNNSKFGQRFNKVQKKLKPVRVKVNKAQSLGFGALDKIFGGIGKVLNLGNVIKKFALMALGYFLLMCLIILMTGGIVVQLFNVFESESVSTQPGKYTSLLAQGVGELVQKDNNWLVTLKDLPSKSTPQSVTGKKQYTLKDPFTGKTKEITAFGTGDETVAATYKCYDAWGWNAIFNKSDGIDKEALKKLSGHQISEYSNSMAILACASYYCMENDIETSGKSAEANYANFSKVYNMFWNHSHCYGTSISDELKICPGKNCTKATIDCRSLDDESLKKKNISKVSYHDDFTSQVGKICDDITYYCNDPSSWEGIKFFKKGSTDKPSGKGCKGSDEMKKYDATLYCSWSGKEDLNPEPPASVPNGAKGSFEYHYKTKDDVISSSMDDCKDAEVKKNSIYFDTSLITSALNSDITLLKKGKNFVKRKVDNKDYYCAYTSNIQSYTKINYANKVDPKDGFFLFEAKYVDPKSETITPAADGTICTNDRISWFYNCQGHEVDGYTMSYCPGHKGCKGHDVTYCLGHLELEVYSCIAGFNDLEKDTKQKPLYNIASIDDLFFKKNKDGSYASDDQWDYAEKWKGFREEGRDLAINKLDFDWNADFGIPPEAFQISNPLGKK